MEKENMKMKLLKANNIVPYIFLFGITAVLSFFILHNSSWMYTDILPIFETIASGKFMSLQEHIVPSAGRFFPLSIMHFNVLLLFNSGETAIGYFILIAIFFVAFVFSMSILLHKVIQSTNNISLLNAWSVIFLVLLLIQRFFFPVFLYLQYPEHIILPLFGALMLCLFEFYKTDKLIYALMALLLIVFTTYFKEIIFGAFLVFAGTNLIFNYKNLSRNNRIFQWAIVVNSIVFLILYYFIVLRFLKTAYYSGSGLTRTDLIQRIILNQRMIAIAVFLVLIRLYAVVIKKDKTHLFYDSLLFSGFSYFVACVILKLEFYYYYSPGVILTSPAILYYLIYYIKPKGTFIVLSILMILYVNKIVPAIKENQNKRLTEYNTIEKIADYANNGYTLLWYEVKSSEKSPDIVYREWDKTLLNGYINYILKNKPYKFKIINSLANKNDEHSLLIYSSTNDLIKPNNFKSEIRNVKSTQFTRLEYLTIYELVK